MVSEIFDPRSDQDYLGTRYCRLAGSVDVVQIDTGLGDTKKQ